MPLVALKSLWATVAVATVVDVLLLQSIIASPPRTPRQPANQMQDLRAIVALRVPFEYSNTGKVVRILGKCNNCNVS